MFKNKSKQNNEPKSLRHLKRFELFVLNNHTYFEDGRYRLRRTFQLSACEELNNLCKNFTNISAMWFIVDFVNKFMCKLFTVKGTTNGLKNYTLLASNDNFINESVILHQGQTTQTQSYEIKENVINKNYYRYYKLNATAYQDEAGLYELNFYGRSQN